MSEYISNFTYLWNLDDSLKNAIVLSICACITFLVMCFMGIYFFIIMKKKYASDRYLIIALHIFDYFIISSELVFAIFLKEETYSNIISCAVASIGLIALASKILSFQIDRRINNKLKIYSALLIGVIATISFRYCMKDAVEHLPDNIQIYKSSLDYFTIIALQFTLIEWVLSSIIHEEDNEYTFKANPIDNSALAKESYQLKRQIYKLNTELNLVSKKLKYTEIMAKNHRKSLIEVLIILSNSQYQNKDISESVCQSISDTFEEFREVREENRDQFDKQ